MKAEQKYLIRTQLEKSLAGMACMRNVVRPTGGWLRGVREALGMSGRQFARRLGVSPPRITNLEQSERSGAVTIRSMQQAAEALDCVFVYGLRLREKCRNEIHSRAE